MMRKQRALTDKQKLFIHHYLLSLNATDAARQAGYRGDYNTLHVIGIENLQKPTIRSAIDKALKKRIPSIDETLARVADQATSDLGDFTSKNADGTLRLDLAKAYDSGKFRLVKRWNEVETTYYDNKGEPLRTVRKVNLDLYPADAALDKLMRYHSLYHDSITVKFEDELLDLVRSGQVSREEIEKEVGVDFAQELFASIGIVAE